MDTVQFSIPEIFSFIGVVQCIYILVYMAFRADKLKNAGIPFLYFIVLGAAFFLDFAQRFLEGGSDYYALYGLMLWFAGPPLSVLVVMQIAQKNQGGIGWHYAVLTFPFLALFGAYALAHLTAGCADTGIAFCADFRLWLILTNMIAGGTSLLFLWVKKDTFRQARREKFGQERYWLILTILINNIFFLMLMLAHFNPDLPEEAISRIRTLLGLVFIYLVTTSLFRVYPQTLWKDGAGPQENALSEEDLRLAERIKGLLEYEKIYHEPGYGRSELSRELGVSEFQISNVINTYFGKSLPQLINEYRVADAKNLLLDTSASIKVIAEETGFNSIATFNRVFREVAGETPSAYRKNMVEK